MENSESKKVAKSQSKKSSTVSLRVKPETRKKVLADLTRLNKKPFGKTIKADAYIARAVSKLTSEDLEALQNESLSNKDRFDKAHADYCAKFGAISKDDFLGKVTSSEIAKLALQSEQIHIEKPNK